MILVLINVDDKAGLWLARSLKQICAKPVRTISAEELVYAPFFSCGFRDGQAFFSIRLHTGFHFTSTSDFTVLNRITYLPEKHLSYFKQEDQDYVKTEQQAVFTFLFSTFSNSVFNGASGRGLSGVQRSSFEWKMLAQKAGFKITELVFENKQIHNENHRSSDDVFYLIAFEGKCYGKKAIDFPAVCRSVITIQKLACEKIVEVELQVVKGDVFFKRASVTPQFRDVDESFLYDLKKVV